MSSSTLALDALKAAKYAIKGREHTGFIDDAIDALEAVQAVQVEPNTTKEDANNYCLILTAIGMEEEGDPVAEVKRLVSHYGMDDKAVQVDPVAVVDANDGGMWADILPNVAVRVGDKLYLTPQEPAVNAELLEACKAIVAWDDAENNAPEYASDNGAHWRMRQALCSDAFDKARAAVSKATGSAA